MTEKDLHSIVSYNYLKNTRKKRFILKNMSLWTKILNEMKH